MTDQEMALLNQLLGEMRTNTGRLAALEAKVTGREEICAMHRQEMYELKKEVRGNGQPGLKQKVEGIEDRQNRQATSLAVFKTKVFTWAAAGGFIGSGVLFVVANWDTIKRGLQALGGN